MPKISIIVPVYGVEKYIKKCIDSLVHQTFEDFEIIVVDDGTEDKSIEIVEKNFKDSRIKIYHKKNGGAASAKNFGIKKAQGEYLFFVDSDDYVDKRCLEEMYNLVQKKKVDLVICDYYKLLENGEKTHEKMIPFYDENNKKCSVIAMPGPVGKLMKKSYFLENNITFLENHYFEDNAIMPFVCSLFLKFAYVEEPLYYYLQREGSALNKKGYDKSWEDIFESIEYMYNCFVKTKKLEEFYDEVEYIFIEYLLHAPSLRFVEYQEGWKNIHRIKDMMKDKFPHWQKNKYYRQENIKYKIICSLFYHQKIKLAKILLRK